MADDDGDDNDDTDDSGDDEDDDDDADADDDEYVSNGNGWAGGSCEALSSLGSPSHG